jgi:MFS family permease
MEISLRTGLRSGLAKLLAVRWLGQISDGIFQSALASFVLFSPERQADPVAAALAFALVLLPYSAVGPYVGTLLDSFSRQRIIQFSNYVRSTNLLVISLLIYQSQTGLPLIFFVLISFGINRLILAGLSAGLPLVIQREHLVEANALAVTGGTIGVVIGGGIGIGLTKILGNVDHSDSVVILFASLCYLTSGLLVRRLRRHEIGPIDSESPTERTGFRELSEGFRILRQHGDSLRGIIAVAMQRGGLTALTMQVLLLERNTYHDPSNPDAGLSGFAQMLTIAGIGIAIGAFISPIAVNRFGRHIWIRTMMVIGTPTLFIYTLFPNVVMLALTAFTLALCGQSVKVTNDALVQTKIHDEYRGRVFAFYDVAVNASIVSGAIVAAFVLPLSGDSVKLPLIIATTYGFASFYILRNTKFSARSLPTI